MDIKYLGHSSFRIRGKSTVVVTDPFVSTSVGLKYPSTDADIVTISHEHTDHNAISEVKARKDKQPLIVRGPGEYEIQGVRIYGFSTYHDKEEGSQRGLNTMYRIQIDGVSILHCGDLGHALSAGLLDEIDNVDILIVPTGGHFTINEKEAAKVVSQVDPKIVIPMHYRTSKHATDFSELTSVDEFLKAMDKTPEPIAKLSVTRDKLPAELEVVVLQS